MTEAATADDRSAATPARCSATSATGTPGACDRYANDDGELVRVDPHVAARAHGGAAAAGWCPSPAAQGLGRQHRARAPAPSSPAIGAGTTYPDYKPAPFIVSSEVDGVDMVTVVTEGIFSYCGVKVKIDTDRHLGPEARRCACDGEQIGHVTTAEYGSQMLSLGGVHHLTGGSKKEGRVTCDSAADAVQPRAGGGRRSTAARRVVVAGRPAAGHQWRAPRSACASAAARPPSACSPSSGSAMVDEVVVVDDHITGVLTEHQAGKFLDMRATGIRMQGPPLDAGPLLPGGRARHRLGRHRSSPIRSPILKPFDPEDGLARPAPADGLDHRRALRLFRARRSADAGREGPAARAARCRSSASPRTASRRCAPCCSWAAPAARCAPASPRIRCA